MPKNALLIVDVQNDFVPGGALAIPEGDQVIPIINELERAFTCIVATKDWHPPHHVSFASFHGKKPGELIEIKGIGQELWQDHCVQGTIGAEFAPTLHIEKIEKVFFKGTDPLIDSYSTFYDTVHLRSTGLGEYLKARGVYDIYFVGLATEYCVKYSVLDAVKLGFKAHVIVDACRGIDLQPGNVERALFEMKAVGGEIINSSEFLSRAFQN